MRFRTNQAGSAQVSQSNGTTITTSTHYTFGISRSGEVVTLYQDGSDASGTVVSHTDPKTSSRSALIGVYEGKTGNPLDGKIEFLRVFGGIALQASEHLAWHNALK